MLEYSKILNTKNLFFSDNFKNVTMNNQQETLSYKATYIILVRLTPCLWKYARIFTENIFLLIFLLMK